MLFKDLSWMDVQRYLARDDRVVVITGSCEQHGYLSLLTDVSIPVEVARQACHKEGVLIAPPLTSATRWAMARSGAATRRRTR
jgi:creatinine amidohydrolase